MKNLCSLLFICVIFASNAFAKPKGSMVVLDPASIEILYMIGAEDEILAIPDMQNIRPLDKTKKVEKVGTYTYPNLEKILQLKPKLAIITSYSIALKEPLNKNKIETIMLPVTKLQDIHDNILKLGEITHRKEKAMEVAGDFDKKIQELKSKPLNKSGVFIYSQTPLMVFGGDTLPSDVLNTIGIKNIAQNVVGNNPIISAEFLLKQNPDIIMYGLRASNKDDLINSNPVFKKLSAIKNNNAYFLELYALLRGSPSIIEEIWKVREMILQKH